MRVLIVSGGMVEDAFALSWIKKHPCDRMIAADAGMEFFYRCRLLPDFLVGDFDSADHEILNFFLTQPGVEICRLNPVKDDTDTESAIRKAIALGADEITILGATGSRLDHVLGNVALLGIGLETKTAISIVDSCNRIRMMDHEFQIRRSEQFGEYVSLIPYGGSVSGVTLSGFKYELNDCTMGGFNSLGISNEITAEVGRVSFSDGIFIVIESKDSCV